MSCDVCCCPLFSLQFPWYVVNNLAWTFQACQRQIHKVWQYMLANCQVTKQAYSYRTKIYSHFYFPTSKWQRQSGTQPTKDLRPINTLMPIYMVQFWTTTVHIFVTENPQGLTYPWWLKEVVEEDTTQAVTKLIAGPIHHTLIFTSMPSTIKGINRVMDGLEFVCMVDYAASLGCPMDSRCASSEVPCSSSPWLTSRVTEQMDG